MKQFEEEKCEDCGQLVSNHNSMCPNNIKNSDVYQYQHSQMDEEQVDPNDYPDTPEGDADFHDDYWQGNIEAELYHDDMGDR